jgi:hypothetical protein
VLSLVQACFSLYGVEGTSTPCFTKTAKRYFRELRDRLNKRANKNKSSDRDLLSTQSCAESTSSKKVEQSKMEGDNPNVKLITLET